MTPALSPLPFEHDFCTRKQRASIVQHVGVSAWGKSVSRPQCCTALPNPCESRERLYLLRARLAARERVPNAKPLAGSTTRPPSSPPSRRGEAGQLETRGPTVSPEDRCDLQPRSSRDPTDSSLSGRPRGPRRPAARNSRHRATRAEAGRRRAAPAPPSSSARR